MVSDVSCLILFGGQIAFDAFCPGTYLLGDGGNIDAGQTQCLGGGFLLEASAYCFMLVPIGSSMFFRFHPKN